ncbi:MAG: hypothetical protein K0S00_1264 [Xanthobacteraceae bacterium]|nr:hypothetical protein [Xanthobacteraceae bacterium]
MKIGVKAVSTAPVEIPEAAVDQAVEACGGDLRETVRALLAGQVHMGTKISAGYTRRLPFATMDAVNGK